MSNKGKRGKTGNQKPFLSTGEVANILGMKPRTVRHLAKRGQLPTTIRFADEGHYRYPKEAIEKLKENTVISSAKLATHMQLGELVILQKQLGHLENIRQRIKELGAELEFYEPQFLHIPDLSTGERHFPFGRVVRWQQLDDGSYSLRFGKKFDLVMEHLRSSGHEELLRKLEQWQRLGGNCVVECHRLQASTRELARRRTKIEKELDTGQWARGLYEGFWWTIYSGGFSDAIEEREYIIASEHDGLCLLHELRGNNVACIRPDEVEIVRVRLRELKREQEKIPLVREILKIKGKMDRLKEELSQKLKNLAESDITPGKCSECIR